MHHYEIFENTGRFNISLVKTDGLTFTLKPRRSCRAWLNSEGKIIKVRPL